MKDYKVFCLNSMYKRVNNLDIIIPNILKQTDILHVNLIGYKNHKYPSILNNKKIIISSFDVAGTESRFLYFNDYEDVYYFTIDDDILYPLDYSSRYINLMKGYDNNAVCTSHGMIPNLHKSRDFWRKRAGTSFHRGLNCNTPALTAGVGVSCFHNSKVNISMGDFKITNHSDAQVASLLYKNKIPIISIKRGEGWLQRLNSYDIGAHMNFCHRELDNILKSTFKKNGKIDQRAKEIVDKYFKEETTINKKTTRTNNTPKRKQTHKKKKGDFSPLNMPESSIFRSGRTMSSKAISTD